MKLSIKVKRVTVIFSDVTNKAYFFAHDVKFPCHTFISQKAKRVTRTSAFEIQTFFYGMKIRFSAKTGSKICRQIYIYC